MAAAVSAPYTYTYTVRNTFIDFALEPEEDEEAAKDAVFGTWPVAAGSPPRLVRQAAQHAEQLPVRASQQQESEGARAQVPQPQCLPKSPQVAQQLSQRQHTTAPRVQARKGGETVEVDDLEDGEIGDLDSELEDGELPADPEAERTEESGEAAVGLQSSTTSRSVGSASHPNNCVPCAWMHKSTGCRNGSQCGFCHLCPQGELKRRKRERYMYRRRAEAGCMAQALAAEMLTAKTTRAAAQEDDYRSTSASSAASCAGASLDSPSPVAVAPATRERSESSGSVTRKGSSPCAGAPAPEASEAVPSSSSCPSVGSAAHGSGECKPCMWFYKQRGCRNGSACEYCHICPAWELKKRKREKWVAEQLLLEEKADAGQQSTEQQVELKLTPPPRPQLPTHEQDDLSSPVAASKKVPWSPALLTVAPNIGSQAMTPAPPPPMQRSTWKPQLRPR